MKKRALVALALAFGLLSVGLTLALNLKRGEGRLALCEIRKFDYVAFLDLVRKDSASTARILSLESRTPSAKRLTLLEAKLVYLEALIPAVEEQIQKGGAEYGCVDSGYQFLMRDIAAPTFEAMARADEIDRLWSKLEKENRVSAWDVVTLLIPNVVLLVGTLMTLLVQWKINERQLQANSQALQQGNKDGG